LSAGAGASFETSIGMATPEDDIVVPFAVEGLDVRGRVVRLSQSLDALLERHAYPAPVARVVGEAAALTVLLGSSLKFEGRFQFQTKSDGVIDMIVIDFEAPDKLRGYARFDQSRLDAAVSEGAASVKALSATLLGKGYLGLTIDQGPDMQRYQGLVALEGQGLEAAAHQYFKSSEQIPTVVRLAVGEILTEGERGPRHAWRAGGLLTQFLPDAPERLRQPDIDPGDAPEGSLRDLTSEDDAWTEAKALASTVEDHELIDPDLSSEGLLFRLFHERGVRVFDRQAVMEACRCSTERIKAMLVRFTPEERADMIADDGKINVTCEFCSRLYVLEPNEAEQDS
jgi:molecular chaperone Hsp33